MIKVKIRNRYNQAPHMTQDTNEKVTTSPLDIINESQEFSPFPNSNHIIYFDLILLTYVCQHLYGQQVVLMGKALLRNSQAGYGQLVNHL